ncbi:hypothetical protein [Streptomyces sp. URMC 129]|uniref:hypothetical protein n=1 Tax=Streptomyces sp. URMC 129 TaxID=3423407 RepID=UPI003F1C3392
MLFDREEELLPLGLPAGRLLGGGLGLGLLLRLQVDAALGAAGAVRVVVGGGREAGELGVELLVGGDRFGLGRVGRGDGGGLRGGAVTTGDGRRGGDGGDAQDGEGGGGDAQERGPAGPHP